MAEGQKDIGTLVFKRQISGDLGKMHINAKLLPVLSQLDGKKSVQAVAKALNTDVAGLKPYLLQLYKLKLITPVTSQEGPSLPEKFFDTLEETLGNSIGPMGAVVMGDALQNMGTSRDAFPSNRGEELLENIAGLIDFPDMKADFLSVMRKELSKYK